MGQQRNLMAADDHACAPELFAAWMNAHIANDKKFGRKVYRYHPRSDAHSKMLCSLVLSDLKTASGVLAAHLQAENVAARINEPYVFPNGKKKTLDLAVGTPIGNASSDRRTAKGQTIDRLLIACEAKQCMTEHKKSQPRLFDELSSAHEIAHQGDTLIISLGIVVVNVAERFASPLRQTADDPLHFSKHRQPAVTASMVDHLRGLQIREKPGEVGFDAFATIIIDCDNVGTCRLHTQSPAPQVGDMDHYGTFLTRLSAAYADRFSEL